MITGYFLFVKGLGPHPSPLLGLLSHVAVFSCFGALWCIGEYLSNRFRASAVSDYWHLIVGASVYSSVFFTVALLIPGGFSSDDVPLAISTTVQALVLFPVSAAFCVGLILRLRELVLFRRTRTKLLIWRWMVALMVLLSLTLGLLMELDANSLLISLVSSIVLLPLLVLGMINAFRMSWVVRLSTRRKALMILLSFMLLIFCAAFNDLAVLSLSFVQPDASVSPSLLVNHLNAGFYFFHAVANGFGMLYSLIAILVLVFHLPTSSDIRRGEEEVAAIFSLTRLAREDFDPNKLNRTIVESAGDAHSATMAWLAVPDEESGFLKPKVVATHNIREDILGNQVDIEGLYSELEHTSDGVLHLAQALADRRVKARPGEGLESLIVVSLVAHKHALGALFIASDVTNGFDREALNGVSAFATQAAVALDNARLFKEQVESVRLARELAIAQEVQKKLLPQSLPSIECLDMAATSVPAQEVGGDYYDCVELDDTRLAFIVGDVSGKGTSAAFYMAGMQGVFQALAPIMPDPREFLSQANRAMSASMDRNVFITAIYGVVDRSCRKIILARAGHCPAIVARVEQEPRLVHSRGMGIGLVRGPRFHKFTEAVELQMGPGDVIVFYTDGMIESRNKNNEEYGYNALVESVGRWRDKSAEVIHAGLLEDLHQFMGKDAVYDDDMTLLVLKWKVSESDSVRD